MQFVSLAHTLPMGSVPWGPPASVLALLPPVPAPPVPLVRPVAVPPAPPVPPAADVPPVPPAAEVPPVPLPPLPPRPPLPPLPADGRPPRRRGSAARNRRRIRRPHPQSTPGGAPENDSVTSRSIVHGPTVQRNVREQQEIARPGILSLPSSIAANDTILIGSPIWNVRVPRIMLTFAEHFGFAGKTIHPFTTHAMSGLGHASRSTPPLAEGRRSVWHSRSAASRPEAVVRMSRPGCEASSFWRDVERAPASRT